MRNTCCTVTPPRRKVVNPSRKNCETFPNAVCQADGDDPDLAR
jgi:hypothetical protein